MVQKTFGFALMFAATAMTCLGSGPAAVPEIEVSAAGSAIALLGGAMLVIRARRKR